MGDNIRRLRKSRGLNQDKLAQLIVLEIKSLSLIETGKVFASAKTIDKLASVLNVSVSELFISENESNSQILQY